MTRIIAVAMAVALVLLLPAEVDTARRRKPRFRIIERSYASQSFISLPGINIASRFPDVLTVAGLEGSRIIDVDLHLYGFSHDMPENLDILLAAPSGRAAFVMSDAGDRPIGGIQLTLDDDAKAPLPKAGAISSGRYRPANYEESTATSGNQPIVEGETRRDVVPEDDGPPGGDGPSGGDGPPGGDGEPGSNPGFENDDFPAPAPESPGAYRLSTFNRMSPSGTWQLYMRSDGPAAGELAGGWGLTIEVRKRR